MKLKLRMIIAFMALSVFSCSDNPPWGIADSNTGNKGSLNLVPFMSVFVEKGKGFTINDILNQKPEFSRINKNSTPYWLEPGAVWARIDLPEKKGAEKGYLCFHYPMIESLEVFLPGKDGRIVALKTGSALKGKERAFPERMLIVPLFNQNGENLLWGKTIYIRVFSPKSEFNLNLDLLDDYNLHNFIKKNNGRQIIYLTVIILMVIYNFILFVSIKDLNYCFYIIYIIFYGSEILLLNGYFVYFFPITFSINMILSIFFSTSALSFANIFSSRFLNFKERLPKVNRILKFYNVIIFPLIFVYFVHETTYTFLFFLIMISDVLFILFGAIKLWKPFGYARDFTAAWSFLIVPTTLYGIVSVGIYVPGISLSTMQYGHAIETLLLSLALARRIRNLMEEKKIFGAVQTDLALAADLQKYLFLHKVPMKNFNVSARYLPSTDISGDFYDFLERENILSVFLLDVAGHGYSAGLVAAMGKVAYHETFRENEGVNRHQENINRILARHVPGMFATSINMRISKEKSTCEVVNSGHLPFLHFQKEKNEVRAVKPSGIPLGINDNFSYSVESFSFKKGDRFLVFTDGLTESIDEDDLDLAMKVLSEFLLERQNLKANELSDAIESQIPLWLFGKKAQDDITFIVIEL